MGISNVISLLSGIALFLFGMSLMGDGLKKLSGSKLELVLSKLTSNRLKGFLLGLLVTAVIQSSSATTVMLVGFVNSGIMNLGQTMSTIMGANVGTTVTAWLLSLSGINGEKRTTPYLPTDKSNPLNVYGLTKLEGEKAVRKYCKKYYIVRSSWLYGIHGKNFVETILSLKDMPEIKVVDDQAGCPTWTVDLSEGIAELLKSNEYGIYHICGGGQTSWYNFAGEILTLDGASVNIKPCSTEEYPRKAKRPHYSVMDNNGSCRDWKSALKEYMQLRNMED